MSVSYVIQKGEPEARQNCWRRRRGLP